jgi:citrate lyase subunit beta/citryl-CoA lyase
MRLRSLLFIPADSEKKLQKGDQVAADALILDLEDAVAPANKAAARRLARDYLAARPRGRRSQLWVRINPITTAEARSDLECVLAGRPDGIVQPKTRGADDVLELGAQIGRLEADLGLEVGSTRILPVATETAQAMFTMDQFQRCDQRLAALTWGAEDLAAAVGAISNKDADGRWTFPYQLARSLCLFAASAVNVPAIDTLYADFRDPAGLRAACDEARRDGFSGKLAIHPGQVEVINQAFTPSAEEIAFAQRVVAAFAALPEAGTLALDGRMLDIPHLRQAQKILAMADQAAP